MLAIYPKDTEKPVVEEFFQLFKTPWEYFRSEGVYDVVIVTADEVPKTSAQLMLIYNSSNLEFDKHTGVETQLISKGKWVECNSTIFPIFGSLAVFKREGNAALKLKNSRYPVAFQKNNGKQMIDRIGYDLFFEIEFLLTHGQPVGFGQIPTLEHHINTLRQLMCRAGVVFLEMFTAPPRTEFIVCLTHDVDFCGIRRHFLDRTFFGFLYRALIGSLVKVLKQRDSIKNLVQNWAAVGQLPFVYIGRVRDFWVCFDRYLQIEGNIPSTFFFVPEKKYAGQTKDGKAPRTRAVNYAVTQIPETIQYLIENGREIGLHGIDAWIDPEKGMREAAVLKDLTRQSDVGVRMHWLLGDIHSPKSLSDAGFVYDSTKGYNNGIGFPSGTVQIYKPLNSAKTVELPLNVMDTALFYPDRMNLSVKKAWDRIQKLIAHFEHFGGVFTINWHLRSLSPERCWDLFYIRLVNDLKKRRVWFASGLEATAWFKKRRSLKFEQMRFKHGSIHVKLTGLENSSGPGLILRKYQPSKKHGEYEYVDTEIPRLNGSVEMEIKN